MGTPARRGVTIVGINDFKRDSHAAKYVVELDCRPVAAERLFWLLNRPANEQRLEDAEMNGMPALAGVARLLEDDPVIGEILDTDPASLRFRQAVGVAIKLKMAKLGWQTTGTKGAVRGARHFTKAERYAQEELDEDARRERALAALEAVKHIGSKREQEETGRYLMEALAETRRAEGRPF
ncbi:MAG: hypothetical protein KTV68_19800 [Acidimicrobiia bacterium]|nr:hypothetical protein [Acidimicrobiia bacterium]MCY4433911.1 hypothetical protein [bacterium]